MGHPFAEHRQTKKEHSRVGHITKGYAKGGAVKSGKTTHGGKANREMAKMEMEADGEKSAHRMDRPKRAKGGRVKGKNSARTIVNVITGGHPAGGAVPPMPPPAMGVAGPPPGAMPPPMAAKPPMPMPPPGGPPPGMPMRKAGGRVKRADGGDVDNNRDMGKGMLKVLMPLDKKYGDAMQTAQGQQMNQAYSTVGRAKGGRVQTPTGTGVAADSGVGSNRGDAVFNASRESGTHISGTGNNKDDSKDIGRGRVVTFKTGGAVKSFRAYGGKVESPQGVAPATKLPGGAGGGEARLAKEHRADRKH